MDDEHAMTSIMVVDDTPANLKLLTDLLQGEGYRVLAFPSGRLALDAAARKAPDLILLDINMPEMNGFEVCAQLKADKNLKDIPVLFLSGLSNTADKVKAFSVGGVDYVTKPFQLEEVCARVQTHQRLRSIQRQLGEHNRNLERLVAERTSELAKSCERLQELGRIKNDFMCMLSHEIRTPANGVLGIGGLILDLCPASNDRTLYAALFQQSSSRLRKLIEDVLMISDMENMTPSDGKAISLSELLAKIGKLLPEIRFLVEQASELESAPLKGDPQLLEKTLDTMIRLAISFSRDKNTVHAKVVAEEQKIAVHIELDALALSAEQVAAFFDIESNVRSVSSAEPLGLAPVVAYKIISAIGGDMKLVAGKGGAGYLVTTFIK